MSTSRARWNTGRRPRGLMLCAVALCASLAAEPSRAAAQSVVPAVPPDLSAVADAELNALGERWDTLSRDERRALLTEIHRRMVAAGRRPVLRIRAERRFGYRVEQPDGSVLRIQRRQEIVGYREIDPDRPFGMGFERRSGLVPVEEPEADAPTVEVEVDVGPVPRAAAEPVYQLPFSGAASPERRR